MSSPTEPQMRAAIAAFSAAWARADIDALMALMSPTPTYRTSSGASFTGADDVRAALTRICRPALPTTPPQAEPSLQFFARSCLTTWRLPLGTTADPTAEVDGVDIITFDDDARILCKDAYRKLT